MLVTGREVATTNSDKLVSPQAGRTKLDLAKCYAAAAQGALPACYAGPLKWIGIPNTRVLIFAEELLGVFDVAE